MKVKDLPKKELAQLSRLFFREVGADLMDCWGNSSVATMTDVFLKGHCMESRPETANYLKMLKRRHK